MNTEKFFAQSLDVNHCITNIMELNDKIDLRTIIYASSYILWLYRFQSMIITVNLDCQNMHTENLFFRTYVQF